MSTKPKKVIESWMRFTEETNALDYLEKAYFFMKQTKTDLRAWKWVVLCVHSALYGFAICALRGTSCRSVVFITKNGEEKLIDFEKMIKNCQSPKKMKMTICSKHLILNKK